VTPRIVVIGGGYAGTAVARALGRRAQVTIITEDNSLLFTPMLAEVAAGALDPRHIVTPVRQLAPYANVIQGKAERIDVARKLVTVVPRFGLPRVEVEGDALVLALGSVPNTFGVRGVDQHANFFKTIGDALRIRNRLLALLEAASQQRLGHLTTVAVVGAGNSGVELAGALADFLGRAAARFFPQAPRPKVLLVDFVDRVTPSLPERVSAAAERALRGRNVELVLGRRVLEVEESGVLLEDGHQIKAATIVWTGGVKPNPIVAELGLTLDRGKTFRHDGFHRRSACSQVGMDRFVRTHHACAAVGVKDNAARRLLRRRLCGVVDLLRLFLYLFLHVACGLAEFANALTEAFGEFRKLLGAEKNKYDQQDEKYLAPAQVSKHSQLLSAVASAAEVCCATKCATMESNTLRPSTWRSASSAARSGCGIRPSTLPRSLTMPAMLLTAPFGFADSVRRPSGSQYRNTTCPPSSSRRMTSGSPK